MAVDLFGDTPRPHKSEVRLRLVALPSRAPMTYQGAYALCRDIPNRPANWQANIRDELHRLWHSGYFTQTKTDLFMVYVRTDKK